MKKIILSFLTLALVAGVGTLATLAYFNDTETSTGNTFTAGAIDLKVDSEGHYNGLVCRDGLWQDCQDTAGTTDMIVNGSFEMPEVTDDSAKWQIFSSIPGWTIAWESTQTSYDGRTRPEAALQEYHEGVNGWSTPYGNQYAELDSDWFGPYDPLNNEPALVKLSQSITTTVGKKYLLSWAFSPRPGTNAANNILKIRINGVETQVSADGTAGLSWQTYTREFTAKTTSTTIEFAGGGVADSLGVFLDNVQLFAYETACTLSQEFTDSCASTWELKDLDPTQDKFFNFSDIKPGDWGENTISLHVTNNPAYACVNFINMHDDDFNGTEPERNLLEGNDKTEGPDQGEMAENVDVLLWHDDGDNIYEEGETLLTNGVEPASTVFTSSYELFNPSTGAMEPMMAKYLGLAWCAGTMTIKPDYSLSCDGTTMGNEAQTDSLSVDVSLFVEQARHNGQFSCKRPVVTENTLN
ncbi:hypothetical protein GYA19_02755 [Candidatus Beckwithbacteria bacterium]|nr:hypothetical protein [Candidatus Beckwithbacteria bacterium]